MKSQNKFRLAVQRLMLYFTSAFLFLMTSCEKDQPQLSSDGNSTAQTVIKVDSTIVQSFASEGGGELCNCYGYTLTPGPEGDYSCPSGDGCAKIMPCPCPIAVLAVLNKNAFSTLLLAIDEGNLPEFFSGTSWTTIFPELADNSELLSALQENESTVIDHLNENGTHMLFVVPTSVGAEFENQDIQMVLEAPSSLYQ